MFVPLLMLVAVRGLKLLQQCQGNPEEAWGPELQMYLSIIEPNVEHKTNIIKWWQVHYVI